MGIDAGFSWLPDCLAMTSRYTSECFSSHFRIYGSHDEPLARTFFTESDVPSLLITDIKV